MLKKEEGGNDFIRWFPELDKENVAIAGFKGASLAEMYNHQYPVPPGFVVTTKAYDTFLEKTRLKEQIAALLQGIDVHDVKMLESVSTKVKKLILDAEIPKELAEAITDAYDVLDVDKQSIMNAHGSALSILKRSHEPPFVAVRSSSPTNDLVETGVARQHDAFLNVKGNYALLKKVKACFASLFHVSAIASRMSRGLTTTDAQLAVVVQKMVDADKSGVIYSKNPASNDGSIGIEAIWGLGEGLSSGIVTPDQYQLQEKEGVLTVIDARVAEKKLAIIRDSSGENKAVPLTASKGSLHVLSEREMTLLARAALKLEEHYQKPQGVEFAIAGGEIFLVQSHPLRVHVPHEEKKVEGGDLLMRLDASAEAPLEKGEEGESGDLLTRLNASLTMGSSEMPLTEEKAVTYKQEAFVFDAEQIPLFEQVLPLIIPIMTSSLEEKDIEEVILEELSHETYEPGDIDSKKDIPALNDAIPL